MSKFKSQTANMNKRILGQYGVDLDKNPSKGYLFEQADISWKSNKYAKAAGGKGSQVQQMFSDQSLFKAYRKRTRKMHQKMMEQEQTQLTE